MKTTRQEYIKKLAELHSKVTEMGRDSAEAMKKAVKAMLESDAALAQEVIDGDEHIDHALGNIEDRCLLLIAKQKPIAHDLRAIYTGYKVASDLERIADLSVDIANTVLKVKVPLDAKRLEAVRDFAHCVYGILDMSMAAYELSDVAKADEVRKMRADMDKVFEDTFYTFSDFVADEAAREREEGVTRLLFLSRYLERIGDHAVNIAEDVIYIETAERV